MALCRVVAVGFQVPDQQVTQYLPMQARSTIALGAGTNAPRVLC
jgi:hypothetical protein